MLDFFAPPGDEPDWVLFCRSSAAETLRGQWHFRLLDRTHTVVLDETADEVGDLNRLVLWAAVRGLEAIESPGSVKLMAGNRYLVRSMCQSLPRWRRNDYAWDHFGNRVEIQNADLWRRIDHALSIHRVEASLVQTRPVATPDPADRPILRVDPAHAMPIKPRRRSFTAGHPAAAAPTARRRGRRFTAADLAMTPVTDG